MPTGQDEFPVYNYELKKCRLSTLPNPRQCNICRRNIIEWTYCHLETDYDVCAHCVTAMLNTKSLHPVPYDTKINYETTHVMIGRPIHIEWLSVDDFLTMPASDDEKDVRCGEYAWVGSSKKDTILNPDYPLFQSEVLFFRKLVFNQQRNNHRHESIQTNRTIDRDLVCKHHDSIGSLV